MGKTETWCLWILYVIVWLTGSYFMSKPTRDVFVLAELVLVLFMVSWMFVGFGWFMKIFGSKFREQAEEEIRCLEAIGYLDEDKEPYDSLYLILALCGLFFLLLILSGVSFLINTCLNY